MKSYRLERVAEVIRETAATAILFEIKDPRVRNVTVTRAEVSADLQYAKVYVSVMGTDKEQQLALHGLRSAAGFVQSKVAKQLTSRYVPHITFVLDDGVKKSVEISRLIRQEKERLAADRAADSGAATGANEGPPAVDADVDRDGADGAGPDGNGTGATDPANLADPAAVTDPVPEPPTQPGPADGSADRPG